MNLATVYGCPALSVSITLISLLLNGGPAFAHTKPLE